MLFNKKPLVQSVVEPTDTNVYWVQVIPNSTATPIIKTFHNGAWTPLTGTPASIQDLLDLKAPLHNPAFTGAATLNGEPISTNDLNGTNYLIVYGTGTPEENAQEFINAYNLAKTMPRYLNNSDIDMTSNDAVTIYKGQAFLDTYANNNEYVVATNTVINGPGNTITYKIVSEAYAKSIRTNILVAPGYYNFTGEFVHACAGINIKSLSGDSDVYVSAITPNSTYVFGIETDFTEISGLVTNHITYPNGRAAIRVAPNLQSDLVVKKCISGKYSFWDNNTAINATYYGTFIDCEGDEFSFVGGNGGQTLSGKFVRCKGGHVSFGSYAILANATFENCEGALLCFGSTDGEHSSTVQNTTVFKNCWALNQSFGFNATLNQGKYYYCINTGGNSGVLNGSTSLYCSKNGVI